METMNAQNLIKFATKMESDAATLSAKGTPRMALRAEEARHAAAIARALANEIGTSEFTHSARSTQDAMLANNPSLYAVERDGSAAALVRARAITGI